MKHGGHRLAFSKKYGIPEGELLDFSANINPLGPSPRALEAMQKALAEVAFYPDPEQESLRGILGRHLGIPMEQVVLGNGAAELIDRLLHTLKPERAVIFPPTFSEYGRGAWRCGVPLIELNGLEPWLEKIGRGDLVFLCNPNNPTGNLLSPEELEHIIIQTGKRGAWLVLDESFMDFVQEPQVHSWIPKAESFPHLLILYSLTKFFALPGLRLGSLVTGRELAGRLRQMADPWVVNGMALRAGEASLTDREYIERSRAWIAVEGPFLAQGLGAIPGWRTYPAAANFVLVDLGEGGPRDWEWVDRLGREGIMVRSCASFGVLGQRHLRFAVRTREENRRLLETLHRIGGGGWEG